MWQTNHLTVALVRIQDTGTHTTDVLGEGHHEFLADRVDGRVGYLGELLTEVVEEYLRFVADNSQRSIVTHGSYRLLTCSTHRNDSLVDVLLTETEGDELAVEVLHSVADLTTRLQLLQLDTVGGEPLTVWMCGSQLLLYLAVIVYLSFLRVNKKYLTWLQTSLALDVGWIEVHNAYLGSNHHYTALRNGIT